MDTPITEPSPTPVRNSSFGYVFLSILIILLLGISVALVIQLRNTTSTSGNNGYVPETVNSYIQGTFNINGTVPDGATVDLVATQLSDGTKTTFESEVAPIDTGSWHFAAAKAREAYSIQAVVQQNGKEITRSAPLTVTAPADDEVLSFNLESTSTQRAVITGDIVVNGFIPQGATISVQGRIQGDQNYTTVSGGLTGLARQAMTYATAVSGTTYEVRGQLLAADGSTVLGTSSTLVVTAPASHEELIINSTAQTPAQAATTVTPNSSAAPAPVPSAVISGTIDFNGIAPPNSRIVIFQKVYNTQNYQVAIDNIAPVDGQTWTWKNPAHSTWYDMIAVLKQKQSDGTDKDISSSSMASVAAPAAGVKFTLNSSFGLNAPTGHINTDCGTKSGNTWPATLTFDPQSGAGSYWYQVGTTSGGTDTTSTAVNANGSSPLVAQVGLQNGIKYYVQYAYGILSNLGAGNRQFSPFSQVHQIQCGN